MDKETTGTVISVKKQWWLKINTKSVRLHALDGAIFPHIIKVEYTVDGQTYTKRKWIGAGYVEKPAWSIKISSDGIPCSMASSFMALTSL